MQLTELYLEYRATADKLQARLAELRIAQETATGEDALLMRRRMEMLYAELLDLRIIMAHLKNYYTD